ncbi:DUF6988 family protein [Aliivibrio fischeri]|uniref:DUF6988 family protein n=1 Tax=Aliivibrio fischeri TaxID=668 RepID=UPI000AA085D3|nr:DUF5677 domain-containing protein [Aliivibrio fischeri]
MKNTVGSEIMETIGDINLDLEDRDRLSLMLNFIVFDTQRAIFDLIKLEHFGSASALLRVLFEAHVKAEWLKNCASEKQVEQFKSDHVKSRKKPKNQINFQEMVEDLESKKKHLNGSLQDFKDNHWKGLNSFTHSGLMQLSQFQGSPRGAEANPESTIDFANRFAIQSLGNAGIIMKNVTMIKKSIHLSERVLGISI